MVEQSVKLSGKTYYPLFRTVDGSRMTFYFHLNDDKLKKKFEELVKDYGGDIVEKYNDMSPYTALMVEDKCENAFSNRVSFRVSYISECINDGILLNINFYIQSNDVTKFKANDYMKVIYLREATFVADQICQVKQDATSFSSNNDNVSKPVQAKASQSNLNRCGKLNLNTISSKSITKNRRNKKSVLSVNNLNKEDIDFRRSSSNSPEYNSIEKPDDKSSEIKCLNPCPHCILHMDRKSDYFSANSIKTKASSLASQSSTFSREKVTRELTRRNHGKFGALLIEKCEMRKDVEERECSAAEDERCSRRTRRKRINVGYNDRSDGSQVPCCDSDTSSSVPSCEEISPKEIRSLMCARQRNAQIYSEDDDEVGRPQSSKEVKQDFKHSRFPYSREEKIAILRYIIRKDAYHTVGGVSLWKKMELSNICPRRTWMSLQNHFKRCLIKELETFQFLSQNQINLLRGY